MRFNFLIWAFLLVLPATCESGNYTHIELVNENAAAKSQNLDPCPNNNAVSPGTCQCTSANHPVGCTPVACQSSTQTHPCLCTGTNADTATCECTPTNHPNNCTCSTSYHLDGCSCNMKSREYYSLEQGLACMRSIPLTSTEKSTTIDLLKNYLSGYVFLDTSLNPPGAPIGYGKHAVDIMGTLDAIGANASYINTFDFYEDIMVLLNNLKDPHTIFTPPCIQKLIYAVASPQIHKNTTDSSYYVTASQLEVKYINWKGLPIYSSGTTLNEGSQDPIEAIVQFADEEISLSKNPVARLNQALKSNLQQRSAQQFKHPESNQITMHVIVPTDLAHIYTLTNIVQVYASGDVNKLKDECPLNSEYSILVSNENKDGIWIKMKFAIKKIMNKTIQQINGFMKRMKKNDDENEKRRHFEEIMHKLDEEQTKITRDIEERINPKLLIHDVDEDMNLTTHYTNQDDIIAQIKHAYKSEINDDPIQYHKIHTYSESGSDLIIAYHIPSLDLGVLVITTFGPDNLDSFAQAIFNAIKEFTDVDGDYHASKLMIDVRGNGGGKVVAGRQALNFIFPQAGHPIYQTTDQMKTTSNNELTKLMAYASSHWQETNTLALDVETMQGKPTFYTQGNRQRTTTSPTNTSKTLTVDLTDKYVLYMGNTDAYKTLTTNWNLKRKELFSPENVLVITDGNCGSTCSQFVKHIGDKHLGRIAGIGIKNPLDLLARFDIGMATSATVTNVESIQLIKNEPFFDQLGVDRGNLPGNLFRSGTRLTYSDRGGYGFTDESKESLYEYYIVDPDFRVEHEPYNDDDTDAGRIQLYLEVHQQENQLLSSITGQPKKCFSWEVDVSGAVQRGNCKGCIKDDQHSVFGYPCSTRGQQALADGSSKIGEVDSESCVFSHCKVGYYRKNVNIGSGVYKDQCIEIPLGPNQNRADITPDTSVETINDDNVCTCPTDLTGISTTVCPCKTSNDPRSGVTCPITRICQSSDNLQTPCLCSPNFKGAGCTCSGISGESDKCLCSRVDGQSSSCTCTLYDHPQGCTCPNDSSKLVGIPISQCKCRSTSDPRAGKGQCPAYCTKESLTENCVCDTGSSSYPSSNCDKDKKCAFDLGNQTNVMCPCLPTQDPRAGKGQCPAYCISKINPSSSCMCDSQSQEYLYSICKTDKECTFDSNSTVEQDSCTCSQTKHPQGCSCPYDSSDLYGIPQLQCECRTTGDPRAGISEPETSCPAYCVSKDFLTENCTCDTESQTYQYQTCIQDQECKYNISEQNNTYCICLETGDPRAGQGQCPAYCVKGQVEEDCTCDSNITDYSIQQCQIEKSCKYDLYHQTKEDCPCLQADDPMRDSIQKQEETYRK
ncbi:MAG: hypothetical protein EZS28_023321 [Streblomastix strix]|uniref:Tail specific protease domain-containing protein n=1 Tax=Streblomastix strix TaxID=222440 RepID=A0A5J4VFB1_9EUKA|nr:MAG: hypothetical protein EZS28_023321 [Streblomastix strix]